MRILIQRVKNAKLESCGEIVSQIGFGYNVFVGVTKEDTIENMKKVANRIATIRLFYDENEKLNNNISQVNGEILLVSNFTLCDKKGKSGARPDFTLSADKEKANDLYLQLQKELVEVYKIPTKLGCFGEDMQIYCQLDGPINIVQEY